jgi:alanine dehydrogenase
MKIGIPKEIKNHEYRVGLMPAFVRELVQAGHSVMVQTKAGHGVGQGDDAYEAAGATIAPDAATVFAQNDMIIKVKEPQPSETAMLREGQILFTYLHLAPDPVQAEGLVQSKCVAIAYETITSPFGGLPCLAPMSEVAGRMGPLVGANALFKHAGGRGKLATGVPGVDMANILVLGGGVSGYNAARVAIGLGASVTILEKNPQKVRELDNLFEGRARVLFSSRATIEEHLPSTDMVIGAVLIPGAAAPKLISKEQLKLMKPGSVIVDIAIDQGGCVETARATTHQEPTYIVDDIVHYCVANMPGAVPVTSTQALNAATLPYALAIANKGWKKALSDDLHLANGLNVSHGHITNEAVATALGRDHQSLMNALAG